MVFTRPKSIFQYGLAPEALERALFSCLDQLLQAILFTWLQLYCMAFLPLPLLQQVFNLWSSHLLVLPSQMATGDCVSGSPRQYSLLLKILHLATWLSPVIPRVQGSALDITGSRSKCTAWHSLYIVLLSLVLFALALLITQS